LIYPGFSNNNENLNPYKIINIFIKKVTNIRTLNISISDMEFNNLGIKNENITFTEFIELVRREVMRNNLSNCLALAEKVGLSSMTINEINEEIKLVRNAKNRH